MEDEAYTICEVEISPNCSNNRVDVPKSFNANWVIVNKCQLNYEAPYQREGFLLWDVVRFSVKGAIGLVRATSRPRPIARDHHTSSALIGGKGGGGPSLLHTMLEGPKEYVKDARWKYNLHEFLHGSKSIIFHGHLDYFQKSPIGSKPGDHGIPNTHNRWFILIDHTWGLASITIHWNRIWLRA